MAVEAAAARERRDHRPQSRLDAVAAHVVYLPPYSPDFNPIELLFAELAMAQDWRTPKEDGRMPR